MAYISPAIMESFFQQRREQLLRDGVLYLDVKVIPKASKTMFAGLLKEEDADVVKVKVGAVPEKGRANQELCRFLAGVFDVHKNAVAVVRGQTNQRKVVKILL